MIVGLYMRLVSSGVGHIVKKYRAFPEVGPPVHPVFCLTVDFFTSFATGAIQGDIRVVENTAVSARTVADSDLAAGS